MEIEKEKVIKLSMVDELLKDYKIFKSKGESFSEFIGVSKCIEENKPIIFDWNYVEKKNLIEVNEDTEK